jgi:WD40 repeat protein
MGRISVWFAAWLITALFHSGVALAQDAAEEEVQRLLARAAKGDSSEALRQDVMKLLRAHPGTPAALKGAGLLHDLPSPLDRLDAKTIPELERFDWHPKDTVALLGEHRGRQAGDVACVLFARNGKWLASGSTNGYVRIWDPATMRLKHTLGHSGGAYCLAISKDNSLFATGGGDGQVHLVDMTGDTPKDKGLHKVSSVPLLGLSIAPNGKMFAAGGSDSRVYLWDLTEDPPKEHNTASGHTGAIRAVVYSSGGRLIASCGDDKTVRLWMLTEQNRMKDKGNVETPAGVNCLAFHPSEDKLVSGGADGVIRVWDITPKLVQKLELKEKHGAVRAIAFSATGNSIAAAFADGTVRTWGFGAKLKEKATLEGHKGAATAVAFNPDGSTLATGSTDWTVRLWPAVSGVKPRDQTIKKGHLSLVYTVAFNPDGASLASGSYDATLRFWDLGGEPKEHIAKLKEEGYISTLAFAPDGKTIAAGGQAPMFRACEVESGKYLYGFKDHTGNIARLAWSPDGKLIASCSNDKSVRIWDGPSGKGQNAITAFDAAVNSVTFSPDGKQLLCTSGYYLFDKAGQIVVKDGETYYNDSTVRLYDVAELKERARWKFDTALMSCIAFTSDGRGILAGGSDTVLRHWDALKLPKMHDVFYKGGSPGISVLACSPDGRLIASYGPDGLIQLIDVATRKKLRHFVMHEQFANLAFAPDSRHLALALYTGVVLVIRLEGPKGDS